MLGERVEAKLARGWLRQASSRVRQFLAWLARRRPRQRPARSWRLNHIAKQAASAYVTATKANEVLAATDLPNRIKTEGYELAWI